MNSMKAFVCGGLLIWSTVACAVEIDGDAVLGGTLGAAAGTAIGSALGGRDGAVLGGALGAGVGAAVGASGRTGEHVASGHHGAQPRRANHDWVYGPVHPYGRKKFKHHH